jgi:hypothetical protein
MVTVNLRAQTPIRFGTQRDQEVWEERVALLRKKLVKGCYALAPNCRLLTKERGELESNADQLVAVTLDDFADQLEPDGHLVSAAERLRLAIEAGVVIEKW